MTYLNKFNYLFCLMASITLSVGSSSLGAVLLFLPENGSKAGLRNTVLRLKKLEMMYKKNIRPIAVSRTPGENSVELNEH
jgi:hypothetical protein